jgi:hypothetical protein
LNERFLRTRSPGVNEWVAAKKRISGIRYLRREVFMPRRLYLSIFVVLYVLSAAGVFAQQAEPCGCKDIAQIEYSIREAGAAVVEQQSELPSYKLNTKENYNDSQKCFRPQ